MVSAGTEAASSNRGSNSGGLSGGSDVYTGPRALILVCVVATFYVWHIRTRWQASSLK